jgi:hypothetical protein
MGRKCSLTTNSGAVMRICTFLSLLFVVGIAVPLLAQKTAPPDLSGTWNLNRQKSDLPKNQSWANTIVISCAGPNIAMHWTNEGREASREYIADGKSRIVDPGPTAGTELKAYWKKSVLIIEELPRRPGVALNDGPEPPYGQPKMLFVPTAQTTRWTLSKDGLTLKRQIYFMGGMQVMVYDKQ